METKSAGQAIVDVLRAEGVKHVFGLPGGHVIGIYDALYATPEITHVLVRHEQTAASMAAAHAQLTGEPGICLVTAGPGCTNLLTGIAEAYVGCLPIVILAGRGATATAERGASQEVPTDQIFAPVTKWAVRVDRTDLIVDVLRQAFAVARAGRPGPVLVDIPRDLLHSDISVGDYLPVERQARPPGGAAKVAAAAEALARAERPLIVAGGGALMSEASEQVRALAELLAIPVLTTLAGRGTIPDDHLLSAGGLGAHKTALSARLLQEADVVLGLGARFEEMETNWKPGTVPSPDATYIQVDIEPAELGRSVPAQIAIVADVRTLAEQLIDALRDSGISNYLDHPRTFAVADEMARLDAEIAQQAAGEEQPMHPLRPIRAIREAFPRETTVAFDVGCLAQHMAGATPYFKVYEPRSTIVPSSFYGMGFVAAGLPTARLVHPDRPAVCFVGDGSFQMVMNVLPVAAEYRLGVTWCVLNDGALGSIRDIQQFALEDRIIATDFTVQPDFATIARACGCHGEHVEDPDGVEAAIARALEANAQGIPAVLDFVVARERVLGTFEHFAIYPDEMVERARQGAALAESSSTQQGGKA
ncbi:MAG TPA: thiamine pyrophosphate-binding protein [Thermoleophilaceae bacterium]